MERSGLGRFFAHTAIATDSLSDEAGDGHGRIAKSTFWRMNFTRHIFGRIDPMAFQQTWQHPGHGYNRGVQNHFKWLFPATMALSFAACHSSMENKEAVQRGIMDRLSSAGLSTQNMDVDVNNVQFRGGKAEADVEVRPKGASHGQGMQMHYSLENQSGRWVVTSRADMAGHGGPVMPGSANPHGSGAMPAMSPDPGSGSRMPSPQDLPPAGKKQ